MSTRAEYVAQVVADLPRTYSNALPVIAPLKELAGKVYDNKVKPVVEITGATTLTIDDSGKLFVLKAAAGAQVTLPAVASSAGFKAKFVVGLAFATTNWTLKAATNKIQGGAIVNSTFVPGADENTISFVATAETLGDYITIECDGTNWYADGVAAAAGGITFTAP